jgi:hypothetical protein
MNASAMFAFFRPSRTDFALNVYICGDAVGLILIKLCRSAAARPVVQPWHLRYTGGLLHLFPFWPFWLSFGFSGDSIASGRCD